MKYFLVQGRIENSDNTYGIYEANEVVHDLDSAARQFAQQLIDDSDLIPGEDEDTLIFITLVISVESDEMPQVLSDEGFLGSDAYSAGDFMPPDPDENRPDIADFLPIYRGAGEYDDMCYTQQQLVELGIREDQWWTLLLTEFGDLVWAAGFHFVNRANGPESYIYTRLVPPDDVFEAVAYIHEETMP